MIQKFWDRFTNGLRGRKRPHWCSLHKRYYNAEVFKDCPDCLAEQGPFFPKRDARDGRLPE